MARIGEKAPASAGPRPGGVPTARRPSPSVGGAASTGSGPLGREILAALEAVLASGDPGVSRLHYAKTSVAIRVTGEEAATTLLLDRTPCEAVPDEPAEVTIELRPELARRFIKGRLEMPAAIIAGEVAYSGPVRKYLEVDPVLRGALARPAATNGEPFPEIRGADMDTVDPSLLAIETRDLQKSFGSQQVLNGLNIKIPEGVISVVLGPSGTGKSVLLQHIIGLMRPDSGDVLIRGRPLGQMKRAELMRLRTEIGVMFQDGALFSAMSVYDNVAFPLRQHTDLGDDEVHELVMEHLESVGLAAARDRMPNQLSGGMRKRAGLARALVLNPSIVLCDEPDSGLDPVRTALLGELLMEQHALYGGTMVVVTHNVMLARLISDHITVVWRGKVLESGLAADMFESDTPFVRQFLAGETEGPLGMDA